MAGGGRDLRAGRRQSVLPRAAGPLPWGRPIVAARTTGRAAAVAAALAAELASLTPEGLAPDRRGGRGRRSLRPRPGRRRRRAPGGRALAALDGLLASAAWCGSPAWRAVSPSATRSCATPWTPRRRTAGGSEPTPAPPRRSRARGAFPPRGGRTTSSTSPLPGDSRRRRTPVGRSPRAAVASPRPWPPGTTPPRCGCCRRPAEAPRPAARRSWSRRPRCSRTGVARGLGAPGAQGLEVVELEAEAAEVELGVERDAECPQDSTNRSRPTQSGLAGLCRIACWNSR